MNSARREPLGRATGSNDHFLKKIERHAAHTLRKCWRCGSVGLCERNDNSRHFGSLWSPSFITVIYGSRPKNVDRVDETYVHLYIEGRPILGSVSSDLQGRNNGYVK
jgi:hypothetical protein